MAKNPLVVTGYFGCAIKSSTTFGAVRKTAMTKSVFYWLRLVCQLSWRFCYNHTCHCHFQAGLLDHAGTWGCLWRQSGNFSCYTMLQQDCWLIQGERTLHQHSRCFHWLPICSGHNSRCLLFTFKALKRLERGGHLRDCLFPYKTALPLISSDEGLLWMFLLWKIGGLTVFSLV